MNEEFLHYIWKIGLFDKENLKTSDDLPVEIITAGTHNSNAGPDFSNAKIKIGETTWVGNVEIHINSSDWVRHKHNEDKAFDSVILQAVCKDDKPSYRTTGEQVATVTLEFSPKILSNFQELKKSTQWIPCENKIAGIDPFYINSRINSLLVERIEAKAELIFENLNKNNNNWEETFYQHIARSFGFKLNALPFEMLAKQTPMIYLAKHKNNLQHIEAILFGQSGLLEGEGDEYFEKLKREYLFFKQKFSLEQLEGHLWKFLRLRPANFPTIRISQFAHLIYKSSGLFSKIINTDSIDKLKELFDIEASEYWETHYVFNKNSKKSKKRFGDSAFQNIAINTIVPFIFVYGSRQGKNELQDLAIQMYEQLPAENNAIIKKWTELDMKIENAYASQAFLQLKNEYCQKKRCLDCHIGNKIITMDL